MARITPKEEVIIIHPIVDKVVEPTTKVINQNDVEDEAKEARLKKLPSTGQYVKPFKWAPPFPASKVNESGVETVFVRGFLAQEVFINSKKYPTGNVTLPCNFAHQHASIIGPPRE